MPASPMLDALAARHGQRLAGTSRFLGEPVLIFADARAVRLRLVGGQLLSEPFAAPEWMLSACGVGVERLEDA